MPDKDTPKPPRHGKSMIATFRAERLANRPAHRAERIAARQSLRNERLGRLHPPVSAQIAPPPLPLPDVPVPEAAASPISLFAQLVEHERQALSPAQEAEPQDAAIFSASAQPAEPPAPWPETQLEDAAPPRLAAVVPAPNADEPAIQADAFVPETPRQAAQPAAEPCPDLATLGFGPGMTARLHLLGIISVTDLAAADAEELRNLLGDVGDLVNVDFWINQARTLLRAAA